MRNRKLTKEAKEYILDKMADSDRLDLDVVMDFVREHYIFDPAAAKEQGIRATSRYLIKCFKDDRGLCDYYNYKENGKSIYLDITKTTDKTAYNKAQMPISKQFYTLNEVMKKFNVNGHRIEGQIALDESHNKE